MELEQIINERFKILPKDLQDAILDSNLDQKFKDISDKHGLMMDQIGTLQTETRLVMLGIENVSDFTENIIREMRISSAKAYDISKDVNTLIFDSIRSQLRKIQENDESSDSESTVNVITPKDSIPALEKAGGFSVVRNPESSSPLYPPEKINREDILKQIEADPKNIVDHLLTTPRISKEEVKKPNYSKDPYREDMQ